MSTILIVVVLLVIAGVVIFMATRNKPPTDKPDVLPHDSDTGWNDPLTPGQPARTDLPPKDEPRP